MQSTIPGQENIPRRAVEDAHNNMLRVGDKVLHLGNGREAVVQSTHTAVTNGVRYNEIDVDAASGPWDPKDVRKL